MKTVNQEARFPLGKLVTTPGALKAIGMDEIIRALGRHICGDWGDVVSDDQDENEQSLREGFRLLSAYHTPQGEKFWVITEADRSVTTVLLPEEY